MGEAARKIDPSDSDNNLIPHLNPNNEVTQPYMVVPDITEEITNTVSEIWRRNPERKEYDEVQRSTDVIYIPDIHGDYDALIRSLTSMDLINEDEEWIGNDSWIVFSGDYIDRGEQNFPVLDFVWNLKRQAEQAGGKVDLLVGNHEAIMINALNDENNTYESRNLFKAWVKQGGLNVFIEVAKYYNLKEELKEFENIKRSNFPETSIDFMLNSKSKKKLYRMFFKNGKYSQMLDNMKVFSQIDDVLYVHAGINLEWSKQIKENGIDKLNHDWKKALQYAQNGDLSLLKIFNQAGIRRGGTNKVGGPLWADLNAELGKLSEKEVIEIANNLKAVGINAIVVGHSKIPKPKLLDEFEKHGVKLIGSDTGMCRYYTKAENGKGGVKVAQTGEIRAQSNYGEEILYKTFKLEEGDIIEMPEHGKKIKYIVTAISGDLILGQRPELKTFNRRMTKEEVKQHNPHGGVKPKA